MNSERHSTLVYVIKVQSIFSIGYTDLSLPYRYQARSSALVCKRDV